MEFLHSFPRSHLEGNQWLRREMSAVFSGLFYRPSKQNYFVNIITKEKKSQQSIFEMVQTVMRAKYTGSRYFREAMEF